MDKRTRLKRLPAQLQPGVLLAMTRRNKAKQTETPAQEMGCAKDARDANACFVLLLANWSIQSRTTVRMKNNPERDEVALVRIQVVGTFSYNRQHAMEWGGGGRQCCRVGLPAPVIKCRCRADLRWI